ncbi:MAG: gliding motility protein GldC [Parafilimonas sp.]
MQTSTITIDVNLGEDKMPEQINWKASNSTADEIQHAKAAMISFWDGADKSALRIDLWTKDMMVDEMADFFYQTMITMADTFHRATHQQELCDDIKSFAKDFYKKFKGLQLKESKESGE